jgi:peptidoglycan/xylan/chitin deacetylase (PgdA/CDA1 family)
MRNRLVQQWSPSDGNQVTKCSLGGYFGMESSTVRRTRSLVLDHLGDALVTHRFADLGMAHRHGPRTQKRVALTFDDGPTLGSTESVLETLRALRVRSTFFAWA